AGSRALESARGELAALEKELREVLRGYEEAVGQVRHLAEERNRHQVELAGLQAHLEEARTRLEELGSPEGEPEEPLPPPDKARAEANRLRTFLEDFG